MSRLALVAHRLAAGPTTGVGRYYQEVIRGIASATDHDLVVATTRERGAPARLPPSVEHRTIPGPRKLVTLGWAATGRPRVDRALRHPALVHALHAWAPVPTVAPLVVTIHDVMPLRHPGWYGRVETWSFRRAIRYAADHAAVVVTDSATEAANLVHQAGIDEARIRAIPLGVGPEFRARPPAADRATVCARYGVRPGTYLVALGAVSTRKNLAVVLEAMARAPGRHQLLAVGPAGHGAADVEAKVAALGLEARVTFTGYVDRDDVPVLVGSAVALVHPSRDEGFGLTPLEAMAAGVPALVARRGSLAEVVGDAGVLLDPDDPDAWAAAIEQVTGDPDHRAALVRAGDERQAGYTWERTAGETVAVYRELLEGVG